MTDYQQAILRARERIGVIDRRLGRELLVALNDWEQEIVRLLRTATGSEARRLRLLKLTIDELGDDLSTRLTAATRQNRKLAKDDVLDIWRQAGQRVARAAGINAAGLVPAVDVAAVWSHIDRPAYQSAIGANVAEASVTVNRVIQQGLVRGTGPVQLARQIEVYLAHEQGVSEALRHNVERIAFTEVHVARKEAELWHFLSDEFIEAVRWTLSPDRGKLRGPDICDTLAASNFYGLGPGVYPLRKTPPVPHPWDRCELDPVERHIDRIGEPKPTGSARDLGAARIGPMTDLAKVRVRQHLARLLKH